MWIITTKFKLLFLINNPFSSPQIVHVENQTPFECGICQYQCRKRCLVVKHMKIVHEKSKPFPCTQCPRAFSANCILLRHVEMVHEKVTGNPLSRFSWIIIKESEMSMVLQLIHFSNLRNVLEFYSDFCIWHNYFVLLKKWIKLKLKLKTVPGSTLRLRRLRLRVCRASVPAETRQGGSRKGQTLRLQKMRLQVKIC